jgi:fatty-acyl-CoA synthase
MGESYMSIPTIKNIEDVRRLESAGPWQSRAPANNTYELLRLASERYGKKTAVQFLTSSQADAPTYKQSYSDLLRSIHLTANTLHALGATHKSPIAILLPNLLETHWAIWGAQACGIASPINPMLEALYISRICNETKAEVLIVMGPQPGWEIWSKAIHVIEAVPTIKTVLVVSPDSKVKTDIANLKSDVNRPDVSILDFHTALQNAVSDHLVSRRIFSPSDVCAYFHTGGTTGYPKVAIHTHANESFLAWALEFLFEKEQILLCGLPLFHVNGAIVTGLAAFYCGFEVVMLTAGGFRTPGVVDNFWAFANRFSATTFSAVPTIYAALIQRPLPQEGLLTLKRGVCGAAPLPPQVARDFESVTGLPIFEGYGLTEGTCVSTSNPHHGSPSPGSVGIRLPFQELRIFKVDSSGKSIGECARCEIGVVGIRGPNVFPGYLRDQDNQNIWLGDEWLNTGDLAYLDDQERLVLCGRAKDLIIRGGHNIDPAMIEDALTSHSSIAAAAAIGQPDAYVGEIPVAYVTLKANQTIDAEALKAYAQEVIPERAAVPARIEVLASLPLTAVGKISKPHLRLLATQHVVLSTLCTAALSEVTSETVLSPEKGVIVRLKCPLDQREAANAEIGRLNLNVEWQEQNI